MVELHVYDRKQEEFIDVQIEENNIREFGTRCYKMWNKNGTFKKWDKKVYVRLHDGESYETRDADIVKELKEKFKGRFETDKYTDSEYKGYSEKKATNWTFKIVS